MGFPRSKRRRQLRLQRFGRFRSQHRFQLAFQLFLALPRPRKELTAAALGLVFTVIYAMTDEYHQSFVPGRAMMARDVLIDTLGALLGVFIVLMVLRRQKRKNKAGT